jgi:hypothetical protein
VHRVTTGGVVDLKRKNVCVYIVCAAAKTVSGLLLGKAGCSIPCGRTTCYLECGKTPVTWQGRELHSMQQDACYRELHSMWQDTCYLARHRAPFHATGRLLLSKAGHYSAYLIGKAGSSIPCGRDRVHLTPPLLLSLLM